MIYKWSLIKKRLGTPGLDTQFSVFQQSSSRCKLQLNATLCVTWVGNKLNIIIYLCEYLLINIAIQSTLYYIIPRFSIILFVPTKLNNFCLTKVDFLLFLINKLGYTALHNIFSGICRRYIALRVV